MGGVRSWEEPCNVRKPMTANLSPRNKTGPKYGVRKAGRLPNTAHGGVAQTKAACTGCLQIVWIRRTGLRVHGRCIAGYGPGEHTDFLMRVRHRGGRQQQFGGSGKLDAGIGGKGPWDRSAFDANRVRTGTGPQYFCDLLNPRPARVRDTARRGRGPSPCRTADQSGHALTTQRRHHRLTDSRCRARGTYGFPAPGGRNSAHVAAQFPGCMPLKEGNEPCTRS